MEKFKKFLKYFLTAYAIMVGLMLIHYPPLYFYGTTIEYLKQSPSLENTIAFFIVIMGIALLFIPFLIIARVKYWNILFIGTFSFFVGFEKYMFYLQNNYAPWNIGFNEPMLINFMSVPAIGGLLDAVKTYGEDKYFYLYLIILPLILYFTIIFIAKKLPEVKIPYIQYIAMGLIFVVPNVYDTQDSVPYVYRVMYTIDNNIVDKGREIILNYKRKDLLFKDVNNSEKPENIIMIMDESVRGDLISINNEKYKDQQPYLYSIKNKIINFGNLYSVANCSDPGNSFLLKGVSIDKENNNKPKYNVALTPTIIQYMKNAGYKTYFLDGVSASLFYGLHSYDERYIDVHKTFYKEEKMDRDIKVLDEIKKILKEPGKKFIYVVKQGMHFPYEENFDHNDKENKKWGQDSRESFFNTYMNGLRYVMDVYWKKVIDVVGNTDTVVLYQSDHAVNIVPDKEEGINQRIKLTHCEFNLNHYKELYNIPGFMYSPNKKYYEGFKNLKNGYSARHMTPTLLYFAGYNPKDFEKVYGTSFKNPDKKIPLYLLSEKRFLILGEDNASEVYENIDEFIDPLNKRRILPNSLKEKKMIY